MTRRAGHWVGGEEGRGGEGREVKWVCGGRGGDAGDGWRGGTDEVATEGPHA